MQIFYHIFFRRSIKFSLAFLLMSNQKADIIYYNVNGGKLVKSTNIPDAIGAHLILPRRHAKSKGVKGKSCFVFRKRNTQHATRFTFYGVLKKVMSKKLVIAIDGPSGSGKSTVTKRVAERLGYLYLNTGAMYRAVTLKAMKAGVDLNDEATLVDIAENCTINFADGGAKTFLDGVDVSAEIHLPQVDKVISDIVKIPGVRRAMVAQQQKFGERGGIVTEGRDVTTVVFPDADIKIYLDATLDTRARRRYLELRSKGAEISLKEVTADMRARDAKDSTREDSPLQIAADATVVDTTSLTIEEVVETIVLMCTINRR